METWSRKSPIFLRRASPLPAQSTAGPRERPLLPNQRIARALQKLEERRTKLSAELSVWSLERQHYRSRRDSWSALEVVDHLVRTESSILEMMCRNLSAGKPIPLRDRYKSLALSALMRTPVRVRMPQSAAHLIAPGCLQDLGALSRRWTGERTQLAAFLLALTEEQLSLGLFHHPVGGWSDALGTLAFLDAHVAHHRFQINRIRAAWQQRGPFSREVVNAGQA